MSRRKFEGETERIIAHIIDERRDEPSISPTWVATEAMAALKAAWMLRSKKNPNAPEWYRIAHLTCRQMAREKLRNFFEPERDEDKSTHPLFPELQWRYPKAARSREEEPEYLTLETLERQDWQYNMDRLRSDAQSRLRHADALEDWGRAHF